MGAWCLDTLGDISGEDPVISSPNELEVEETKVEEDFFCMAGLEVTGAKVVFVVMTLGKFQTCLS